MDRDTAERLMAIYQRIGTDMNAANELLRQLPENERGEQLRALGTMMQDLWLNLQLPIVRAHRDLDPDGTRYGRGKE
jgi:hypothetical protein